MRQSELTTEIEAQAEQSYDQLAGEWRGWLEVARRFEHKARVEDRGDLRHTIILRLAQVAKRKGTKHLTEPAMYRVASYCVSEYWRAYYKLTTGLDCCNCSTKQRQKCRLEDLYSECPKLIKLEYLSKPIIDSEGNITELGETIADDKAIDLDAWLERETWQLGYPKRLAEIADKLERGEKLTATDSQYLWRYRKRKQARLM